MSLISDLCTIGFDPKQAELIGNKIGAEVSTLEAAILAILTTVLGTAWVPTYSTGSTMTFTETTRNIATYFQVFGWVFFVIDVAGTIGVADAVEVRFSTPVASANTFGTFPVTISNTGGIGAGGVSYFHDASTIKVKHHANANWTQGASRSFKVSGFYKAAA